ncbi:peptidoglycan/LPS O-acetylase OafA/YrhL [Actinoplanes octamycinicus]|uniref:Peptidoglycan/LPS O-acetylase OafA/YrhL n=2 Tax=Actinoplanes octamycinicus TaxID=135948 RepID=A0A7W7M690_9ACTN|nr:peptidoglycan/LPS O-acetylase OafA/YrhL [Actinoplanes octamycinicus]
MSDLSPATRADASPAGLTVVTGTKPRPEPLDPPMVPFALAGLAAFVIAAVVLRLAGAPDEWFEIAVAGFVVGIPGLITMIVHDRNRKRRRALTHPEFRVEESS